MPEQDEPGEPFVSFAGVFMMIALAILAWQTYEWLRYGDWPPVVLRQVFWVIGWAPPSFGWVGIQRVWSGVLDTSLTLIDFCLGILFYIAGLIRVARAR